MRKVLTALCTLTPTFVQTSSLCANVIKLIYLTLSARLPLYLRWEYADMNRIFKHYKFAFHAETGANAISFSSCEYKQPLQF
jgi:hypothetical protein